MGYKLHENHHPGVVVEKLNKTVTYNISGVFAQIFKIQSTSEIPRKGLSNELTSKLIARVHSRIQYIQK